MEKVVSLINKGIVVISVIMGVILSVLQRTDAFMSGASTFLYFTIQSNIWIGLICLVFIIIEIINRIKHVNFYKRWMYIIKFIFTVSITLTGLVFCTVLAPTMKALAWNITNVLTHVIVPLFSIIDLFVDRSNFKYSHKHCLLSLIPPAYYLIFSLICYFADIKFAYGENFPYFFLNYSSPAGVFGFSNVMPYFMGSFYWIVLMLLLVLAFAYIYRFIDSKIKNSAKH